MHFWVLQASKRECILILAYLDSSLVSPQYLNRLTWIASIPDAYQVIVSTAGQFGAVWGPLETADL